MKKNLFIFVALVYGHALFAQDIITLKNGDEIKAKVQEIDTDNVKYKKYDNQSGPLYTLMKADVFMIKYENGDKDVFTAPGALQPSVSNQTTPPFAASVKTWVFGSQTWSDAIQIPECNKEIFTNSHTIPHCRSYTSGTTTYYYYNWSYLLVNETHICPSPWRVPSQADFKTLLANTTYATLLSVWGYGGRADSSEIRNKQVAFYWSSIEAIYPDTKAWALNIQLYPTVHDQHLKERGYQVRCVK
ncbi:MAG: hypothetical protein LBN98_02900 [Prevotellaceae bacterium]|jgi:hypothetical protein|nr:hypothetical protein [Prevotellaceae bacterium]